MARIKAAPVEDRGAQAWARLLGVQALIVERIELAFAEAGLPSLAWYDVLWELEKSVGGRVRLHELAERVVLSRSNVTRLIDRLEQARLIAREPCADDRRGYFAVLTPAGKEMRKKIWPVYRGQIETLFSAHLSPTESRAMKLMLDKVRRGVRGARNDKP